MLYGSRKIIPIDGRNPENLNAQLLHLKKWLDDNPNINAWKDSRNLKFFLQSCKHDLDRTKNKLKSFYLMRAERVEWFANRDPFMEEIQELLKLGVFLPLDGTDEFNRKVIVIRTAVHNPRKHLQNNVFKVSKMILDLLLIMEPDIAINGIVAIFDMDGVQLGHALQMTPRIIKRSVDSWQTYPCNPKMLEFVNTPTHVNIVLNTFRFFMVSKMRSRVIIQNNGCSVKMPGLPKELGGSGPTYRELSLKWKQLVEDNAQFFTEQEKYKSILK